MNNKTTNKTKGALIPLLFFFYGSLRSGYWNNKILTDSKLLGKAKTISLWDLYLGQHGPVPCVVPNKEGVALTGEVWQLSPHDALKVRALEAGYIEGVTEAVTEKGDVYDAFIYHAANVLTAPYIGHAPVLIKSGDYADVISPDRSRKAYTPDLVEV